MRGGSPFLAALLFWSAPATCLAQSSDPAPALSLDHVGIQSADLEKSVTFYTRVLGFHEAPAPFPRNAARWVALGNGHMLHIVANWPAPAPHNRWDHIALACGDLDAMMARLTRLHVPFSDMDGRATVQTRPDHVRQIFVRDPDGYNIEINDAKAPD